MTTRFLLLLALVLGWAAPAAAGPWPFRSTHSVALGDSVVAVQRVLKALIRQPIYAPECRSPRDTGKKQWKWRMTGTKFYLYDRAGRRLTNHGYDIVARTDKGLIYGVIQPKNELATFEAVSPTGRVTPIIDFASGNYQLPTTNTAACTIDIENRGTS
jgi:hypothetical protein